MSELAFSQSSKYELSQDHGVAVVLFLQFLMLLFKAKE